MELAEITPLILTFNEAANIRRTLASFDWAKEVVVIDSFSSDETLKILSEFSNVRVVQRAFDDHTTQWNFGLAQITSEWVLALDADYVGSDAFKQELTALAPKADVYYARFKYCVFGRPLGSSLYPPRAVLFKASQFKYREDGHTQLLDVDPDKAGSLVSPLYHDDRKSLTHWCGAQAKYAMLEAEKLLRTDRAALSWKDRIRTRVVLAPPLTLFYCLFAKRLILDGWAGIFYTGQRVFAELLLSLTLLDRKLRKELPE